MEHLHQRLNLMDFKFTRQVSLLHKFVKNCKDKSERRNSYVNLQMNIFK